MKGITWARDSHGLFDYESRHLTKKTLKAERAVMIIRQENELSLVSYDEKESFQDQISLNIQQQNDRALLKIVNRNDTFYLESAAHQHHEQDLIKIKQAGGIKNINQEQMYLVVRSLKHQQEKIVSELTK